jgi:SAM-dependent methyltransferase
MLTTMLSSPRFADKWFHSDNQFHHLYPLTVQLLATRHWTPLSVARKAAIFLAAENGARILDIGSGAGKFCLAAAYYRPKALYYGVEQRRQLVGDAETARKIIGFTNVSFIHGNFTQLDLTGYDHFYFYNAFYENLACTDKIDDSITYSGGLYNYYTRYLRRQLEQMPAGTKLATFHSMEDEIPASFQLVGAEMNDRLKCWIKR